MHVCQGQGVKRQGEALKLNVKVKAKAVHSQGNAKNGLKAKAND